MSWHRINQSGGGGGFSPAPALLSITNPADVIGFVADGSALGLDLVLTIPAGYTFSGRAELICTAVTTGSFTVGQVLSFAPQLNSSVFIGWFSPGLFDVQAKVRVWGALIPTSEPAPVDDAMLAGERWLTAVSSATCRLEGDFNYG